MYASAAIICSSMVFANDRFDGALLNHLVRMEFSQPLLNVHFCSNSLSKFWAVSIRSMSYAMMLFCNDDVCFMFQPFLSAELLFFYTVKSGTKSLIIRGIKFF